MKQVSLGLALVLLLAGVGLSQSLGDAAKKEKQRRESAKKPPSRVLTDDDLGDYGAQRAAEGRDAGAAPTPSERASPAPPSDRPPPVPSEPSTDADAPSDTDKLKAKIQRWRDRYRPVKARVDALEEEIKELESKAKGMMIILGPSDPRYLPGGAPQKTETEAAHTRLWKARNELRQARKELVAIEEEARRDGVSSGQL